MNLHKIYKDHPTIYEDMEHIGIKYMHIVYLDISIINSQEDKKNHCLVCTVELVKNKQLPFHIVSCHNVSLSLKCSSPWKLLFLFARLGSFPKRSNRGEIKHLHSEIKQPISSFNPHSAPSVAGDNVL